MRSLLEYLRVHIFHKCSWFFQEVSTPPAWPLWCIPHGFPVLLWWILSPDFCEVCDKQKIVYQIKIKPLFFICCCYELTFRLCQNHSETFAEFQVTFNAYFKHKLTTYCVLFLALCTRNIIQTHLAREAPMYILPKQLNETLVFKSKITRMIEQCNVFSKIFRQGGFTRCL